MHREASQVAIYGMEELASLPSYVVREEAPGGVRPILQPFWREAFTEALVQPQQLRVPLHRAVDGPETGQLRVERQKQECHQ